MSCVYALATLGDSIFDRTYKISTSKTKRRILAYRLTNFDEN